MFCWKCGKEIPDTGTFCPRCGTDKQRFSVKGSDNKAPTVDAQQTVPVNVQPSAQSVTQNNYQPNQGTTYQPMPQPIGAIRPIPLIAVIICAFLWLAAPFMAVNRATLDAQPSALQLLINNVTLIGNIVETTAFWAALVSLFGIIICLVCMLAKQNTATRVLSIITSAIMLLILIASIAQANIDNPIRIVGFGYILIFILLIVVSLTCSKKKVVVSNLNWPPPHPSQQVLLSQQPVAQVQWPPPHPSQQVLLSQQPVAQVQLPYFSPDSDKLGSGIPTYHFNGKGYLTGSDENRLLELAYKGRLSAQHSIALYYMQNNNIENALYWFCVAEHNGEEQATSDLNYVALIYPNNTEWVTQRIIYYRDKVSKNPVYSETFEDIIAEMANDPKLHKERMS